MDEDYYYKTYFEFIDKEVTAHSGEDVEREVDEGEETAEPENIESNADAEPDLKNKSGFECETRIEIDLDSTSDGMSTDEEEEEETAATPSNPIPLEDKIPVQLLIGQPGFEVKKADGVTRRPQDLTGEDCINHLHNVRRNLTFCIETLDQSFNQRGFNTVQNKDDLAKLLNEIGKWARNGVKYLGFLRESLERDINLDITALNVYDDLLNALKNREKIRAVYYRTKGKKPTSVATHKNTAKERLRKCKANWNDEQVREWIRSLRSMF